MRRSSLGSLVVASVVLVLGACSGGSPPATQSTTSTTSPTEGPSDLDVTTLDYSAALFSIDDLNGMLPGSYHPGDEVDMTGLKVRGQCGEHAPEPGADAGSLLEILDETPSFSVTTSVNAFADEADAAAVFATIKDIAKTCAGYKTQGDTFERIPSPAVQPAGDDSFTFYARKPDTGLIAADHFVLQGPFVFDVRWAIAQNSTMNAGISGVVIDQAVEKFIAWVEDQL
jgi:hypothetical protein